MRLNLVVMASSRQGTTRTGYHLRARLLGAANKAIDSASTYINNALDSDDETKAAKPSPYSDERCLVFVSL